jgi:hypothetical protein
MQITKNLMTTTTIAIAPNITVGITALTVLGDMLETLMIGEKITVVGLLQQWRMVQVLQLGL